jgi:hypothetical protein
MDTYLVGMRWKQIYGTILDLVARNYSYKVALGCCCVVLIYL